MADPANDTVSRGRRERTVGGVHSQPRREAILRRLHYQAGLPAAQRYSLQRPFHVPVRQRFYLRQENAVLPVIAKFEYALVENLVE